MSIDKYNLSDLGAGYDSAQRYYASLKQQFINTYSQTANLQTEHEIKEMAQAIVSNQSNYSFVNTKGEKTGETATSVLNQLFKSFANNIEVATAIEQTIKELETRIREADDQTERAKKILLKQIAEEKFQTNEEILTRALEQAINKPVSLGTDSETLSELVARAQQLFKIAVSATYQQKTNYVLTGIPMKTMQGYLREQSELNALTQIFKNSNVKVTHGGSKKVAKTQGALAVETVFDNILSFIDFSEEKFNAQVRGVSAKGILNEREVESKLLLQIKFYGEQVKSFTMRSSNMVTTARKIEGHRITSNEALKNELLASSEVTEGYVTLKQNLSFLASYQNILEVFGPATVLFSSGSGRQWMSDFIQDFRNRGYYLMFKYSNKGAISSTVELIQPILIIQKSKKQIRNRHKSFKSTRFV